MIEQFIANIKTNGLARSNRYTVSLSLPVNISNTNLDNIMLLCDQATIPGVTYSTTQNRTFGEFRETPYEKLYDNATFSFYVDKSMHVKYMFDRWINCIQDPETRKFNYYDSYAKDLNIQVQDLYNRTRYTLNMYEAYPKSINSIQLDYASKDIMKLSVSMQYKYWTSSVIDVVETDKEADAQAAINAQALNEYYNDFYKFQRNRGVDSGIEFGKSSFGLPTNKVSTEFPV